MSKPLKILLVWLLMLLLMVWFPSCGYSQQSLPDPAKIVFLAINEGQKANEKGYWTNEYSGRLIFQALRTYRLDRDHWRDMYWEQNEASIEYADKVMRRLQQIEKDIADREEVWKNELNKARMPGLGVFAGPSYTSAGDSQFAVGIGIVWKIW